MRPRGGRGSIGGEGGGVSIGIGTILACILIGTILACKRQACRFRLQAHRLRIVQTVQILTYGLGADGRSLDEAWMKPGGSLNCES